MVPGFDQTQVEKMQFLKVFQNINWKSKPMNRHWDNFIFWNFFLSPFAVIAPKLFFVSQKTLAEWHNEARRKLYAHSKLIPKVEKLMRI